MARLSPALGEMELSHHQHRGYRQATVAKGTPVKSSQAALLLTLALTPHTSKVGHVYETQNQTNSPHVPVWPHCSF